MGLEQYLQGADLATFLQFDSPRAVQDYLDGLVYDGADLNRTPVEVMRTRRAHCLDGGLLAALALQRLGYPPRMLDMVPAPDTDDDHVLVLFRRNGLWGAIAKSNYPNLRYREPVHRTLRELVMTFFDVYYSFDASRTLRAYTRPFNLLPYEKTGWMTSPAALDKLIERFYARPLVPLLPEAAIAELTRVDRWTYEAGMVGTNVKALYKPKGLKAAP